MGDRGKNVMHALGDQGAIVAVEIAGVGELADRHVRGGAVLGLDAAGFRQFGIDSLEGGVAVLSQRLAEKLGAREGDRVRLAVQQLSAVPRSSRGAGRRS